MVRLEFDNLQKAWEGINEFLFVECNRVEKKGGGIYGPEWISYDNWVHIHKAEVDPEFDFGTTLGYNIKKWSSLVNNYVDFHSIDMIRAEIAHRMSKNSRSYNYAYHFANKHGHGKDCLISLNFMQRLNSSVPTVLFQIRTSEVTKRLLFDFLLVQRLGEYIFGSNDFEVVLIAPSFYITAESFIMYNNVRDIRKLVKKAKPHKFHDRVFKKFDFFYNHPDPHNIKYKVHRRSALQIIHDENGKPISGVKPMYAKELVLFKDGINNYPKDVVTKSQMKAHDKQRNK